MDTNILHSILPNVSARRIKLLKEKMRRQGYAYLMFFENDPIAAKIACTRHYNVVIVSIEDDPIVLADKALYGVALEESPWRVNLIEDYTVEGVLNALMRCMKCFQEAVIGINKKWGRTNILFTYVDVIKALEKKGFRIRDATPLLMDVFDKPFNEEMRIIEWISKVCVLALEEVYEKLRSGLREYEVAAIVENVLGEKWDY